MFLAVEKGLTDVVAYLLECGADPNVHPIHGDGDAPLHYAAARGMVDIVQALCTAGRSSINTLNPVGKWYFTSLLLRDIFVMGLGKCKLKFTWVFPF